MYNTQNNYPPCVYDNQDRENNNDIQDIRQYMHTAPENNAEETKEGDESDDSSI